MEYISPVQMNTTQSINTSVTNNKPAEVKQQTGAPKAEFTTEAANALKAQVLYQKTTGENKTYLAEGLDSKQIIAELKNKEKMGRSFFGYKKAIADIITKAEDPKLAAANFNILMNAKKGKLPAGDIKDILLVATSINNGKMDSKLAEEYKFQGGQLNDKSVDSIFEKIKKQREEEAQLYAYMQQQMMRQQMLDQQMVFQQQAMFQHQMMMDQHMMAHQQMMMHTPGFGF